MRNVFGATNGVKVHGKKKARRKFVKLVRKPSRKSLVKKLDTLFSLFIRLRDRKKFSYCPFPHRDGPRLIECCFHFITRAKYATRWSEDNCIGSCNSCNFEYEFNPHPYIAWFIRANSQAAYERLIQQSRGILKFSNSDLSDKIEYYKVLLEAK